MSPESNPKVGPHVEDSEGTQHPVGKLLHITPSKKPNKKFEKRNSDSDAWEYLDQNVENNVCDVPVNLLQRGSVYLQCVVPDGNKT